MLKKIALVAHGTWPILKMALAQLICGVSVPFLFVKKCKIFFKLEVLYKNEQNKDMIGYLYGKVKFIEEDGIILDVSGIGLKVFCSKKTLAEISLSKDVEFFIHFHRNQTALGLFGFLTKEEKDFFEILIDVSGVGPKAALVITSIGAIDKLKKAIMAGDENFFEKVPGIGKKRIQKIILELAGKINKEVNILSRGKINGKDDEVFEALLKLGFSKARIKEALLAVSSETKTSEGRIREALKILGSSK